MFLRFSAAKNSKNTIPARNSRNPDAPTASKTVTHTNTNMNIASTVLVLLLLLFLLHATAEGAGIVFLRFSAAKNAKNTIPARNWRDSDAPAAIMIMTHTNTNTNANTITITIITVTVTITPPPPTRTCRRAGIVFLRFSAAKNPENTIPAPGLIGNPMIGHPMPHPTKEQGGNRVFEVFGSYKLQKHDSRARSWRDPDVPAAILIKTHTITLTLTLTLTITITTTITITITITIIIAITITITVTITPPPTRHRRRGGNRVFEVFGS